MYYLDRIRGKDGSQIYRTKNGFDYPLQRTKMGGYKVHSGEQLRVCMTSDFFLQEADAWRMEAWNIIRQRPDVKFFLLTKRPERVSGCLPPDWGSGWPHVFFNVTAENQRQAKQRIPLLLKLPFAHRGIFVAPFIGPVNLEEFLVSGLIEQIVCGGENYGGSRPCLFDWVISLSDQCRKFDVRFCFMETGTNFVRDRKQFFLPRKQDQSRIAWESGLNIPGKPIVFDLRDPLGFPLTSNDLHQPSYSGPNCARCSGRMICNGCGNCGKCKNRGTEPPTPINFSE